MYLFRKMKCGEIKFPRTFLFLNIFAIYTKKCSNSSMNPYIFIALAVLSAATAKILHKRVLIDGDPFASPHPLSSTRIH